VDRRTGARQIVEANAGRRRTDGDGDEIAGREPNAVDLGFEAEVEVADEREPVALTAVQTERAVVEVAEGDLLAGRIRVGEIRLDGDAAMGRRDRVEDPVGPRRDVEADEIELLLEKGGAERRSPSHNGFAARGRRAAGPAPSDPGGGSRTPLAPSPRGGPAATDAPGCADR
jgi:hypothetical protein